MDKKPIRIADIFEELEASVGEPADTQTPRKPSASLLALQALLEQVGQRVFDSIADNTPCQTNSDIKV